MKEWPTLYTGAMIRAQLAGVKETRDSLHAAIAQAAGAEFHTPHGDGVPGCCAGGKPISPGDALGRCFDCMWTGKSKCPAGVLGTPQPEQKGGA